MIEKKTKFNVGDRVRFRGSLINKEGIHVGEQTGVVKAVDNRDGIYIIWDNEEIRELHSSEHVWLDFTFDLVEPTQEYQAKIIFEIENQKLKIKSLEAKIKELEQELNLCKPNRLKVKESEENVLPEVAKRFKLLDLS